MEEKAGTVYKEVVIATKQVAIATSYLTEPDRMGSKCVTNSLTDEKHSHKRTTRDGWSPSMFYLSTKLSFINRLLHQLSLHESYRVNTINTDDLLYKDFQYSKIKLLHNWNAQLSTLNIIQQTQILPDDTHYVYWKYYEYTDNTKEYLHQIASTTRASLHGANRHALHQRIHYYSSKQKQLYQTNKFGRVIKSLLGISSPEVDLTIVETPTTILVDPKDIHHYLTTYATDYHSTTPPNAMETFPWYDPILSTKENFIDTASSLLPQSHRHTLNNIWNGFMYTNSTRLNTVDLQEPSLTQFINATNNSKDSAPGISGLTYKMIQLWPITIKTLIYHALINLYRHNHVPEQWNWRVLCYIPKSEGTTTIGNLRPLALIESLRKLWINLLLYPTLCTLHDNNHLSTAQHGYTHGKSTTTATMTLINYMETHSTFYLSSFDFTKAFDSISQPFIDLAYLRLGCSKQMQHWLTTSDRTGRTIIRTPYAQHLWNKSGYSGFTDENSFQVGKGVGQGDIPSPHVWKFFMDILLRSLECIPNLTISSYADDLITMSPDIHTLQTAADVISSFCILTKLSLSIHKFRAFARRPHLDNPAISILHTDFTKITVPLNSKGTLKYLGAHHDINNDPYSQDVTQYTISLNILITHLDALKSRRHLYPINMLSMIFTYKIIPQLIYGLMLTNTTTKMLQTLDKHQRQFIKTATGSIKQFPTALISTPTSQGGLGIRTITMALIKAKNRILFNALHHNKDTDISQMVHRHACSSSNNTYVYGQTYILQSTNSLTWLSTTLSQLSQSNISLAISGYPITHGQYSIHFLPITTATKARLVQQHITILSDLISLSSDKLTYQWQLPSTIPCNLIIKHLPDIHTMCYHSTLHPGQSWEIQQQISQHFSTEYSVYSDGSFLISGDIYDKTLLDNPTTHATAGLILMSNSNSITQLNQPIHIYNDDLDITSAFDMELLGLVLAVTITSNTTIYTDCQSATKLLSQSLTHHINTDYYQLLSYIQQTAIIKKNTIQWIPSHPEKRLRRSQWSQHDLGNHLADYICKSNPSATDYHKNAHTLLPTFRISARQVLNLIGIHRWNWCDHKGTPLLMAPITVIHKYNYRAYITHRDAHSVQSSTIKWSERQVKLLFSLTKPKTLDKNIRLTKLAYDLYQHGRNRAKGVPNSSSCKLCQADDSLQHQLLLCSHPTIKQLRNRGFQLYTNTFNTFTTNLSQYRGLLTLSQTILSLITEHSQGYLLMTGIWTIQLIQDLRHKMTTQLRNYTPSPSDFKHITTGLKSLVETSQLILSTLHQIATTKAKTTNYTTNHLNNTRSNSIPSNVIPTVPPLSTIINTSPNKRTYQQSNTTPGAVQLYSSHTQRAKTQRYNPTTPIVFNSNHSSQVNRRNGRANKTKKQRQTCTKVTTKTQNQSTSSDILLSCIITSETITKRKRKRSQKMDLECPTQKKSRSTQPNLITNYFQVQSQDLWMVAKAQPGYGLQPYEGFSEATQLELIKLYQEEKRSSGTAGISTELIEVVNKGFSEIVGRFQSLETALIQPKTEQSTAVASRDEQPVSQHLQAPDVMVLIDYEYYNTNKTFDKYFNKLFNAFTEANGNNRYRLIKTKHDIRVKDGETV
eukprot:gene11199-23390_t